MMITDRINAAREALRNSGREEVVKSLEAGVPAVYSDVPGTITTEYANGTKLTKSVSDVPNVVDPARLALEM